MVNITAKKSLGQNFLKSQSALRAMISAASVQKGDVVLEIGPGQGALTQKLLETGVHVYSVEKDDRLIDILHEKFSREEKSGQFTLIHGDILESDLNFLKNGHYKLIANIPYYITGLIFRKFLEGTLQPSILVVMVQKEIADRIVASDGKESLLSLSVKAYGTPKKVMKVEKKYFSPAPKVDSAILAISNISKKNFSTVSEQQFFNIIKAGFAHKRKMLLPNLKDGLHIPPDTLKNIFVELHLSEKIRPEDLSIETWLALAEKISAL